MSAREFEHGHEMSAKEFEHGHEMSAKELEHALTISISDTHILGNFVTILNKNPGRIELIVFKHSWHVEFEASATCSLLFINVWLAN